LSSIRTLICLKSRMKMMMILWIANKLDSKRIEKTKRKKILILKVYLIMKILMLMTIKSWMIRRKSEIKK